MMKHRRMRMCFLLCFVWICSPTVVLARSPQNSPDPYKVLGVSKDATQDEIRRQYRKLCLKLHPDKNVNRSPREREKREELFKRVQHANAQIGDEDARRQYEQTSAFSNSPFDRAASEAFSRAFYAQDPFRQQQPASSHRTPFYFNGVDISHLFSTGSRFSAGPAAFWGPDVPLKSVYLQKVKVPLEELYRGSQGKEFVLRDNIWKRYRAAFRGGVALAALYQAILFSLPVLRVSVPASLLLGALLFHVNLPRPSKVRYDVNIQSGWKGGTKLTFRDVEPGFDIVFVLEEEKHSRFTRANNDLKTTITVSASQAREGCTVEIEPLSEFEDPIKVRLHPHEVTRSGQEIRLIGKGWPRRKINGLRWGRDGGRGDLLVTVRIVPDRSRRRKR